MLGGVIQVGEVLRGETDVGVGPLSIIKERVAVVDFTESYRTSYTTLIMLKTGNGSHELQRKHSINSI